MKIVATAPHSVDAATLLSNRVQAVTRTGRLVYGLHLWHLLSLDAPSVAMLWTWFLARSTNVPLPAVSVLAMGLVVWMLYAADRLLDARLAREEMAEMEPRHHFHRDNRRGFSAGIVAAALLLAPLLPSLAATAMRLYAVLGAMLFAYFILIHANTSTVREEPRWLPKELAVGVFFSAAVFIPTIAREPSLRVSLAPGAILFATVCSLNCLFIYAWEHPQTTSSAHVATRIALRYLPQLAISVAGCGILLAVYNRQLPWTIPAACASASVLLLLLHKCRRKFDGTTLRAAADLCLLTPLLLLRTWQ